MYANERGVGIAVERSSLPRSEFFLTSKLSNAYHRPNEVRRSFAQTLEDLRVDQLDLFLMHWPTPTLYEGDYVSTWETMLELVDEGLLRSAGVSNFNPSHLDRLTTETGHAPSVNQIEVYPHFHNRAAAAASARHGVAVEAWSPLGQATVLEDPAIVAIAERYDRSPAQVVLRWHVQQGRIVIPKSAHPERMRENLDIFQFELDADAVDAFARLDRGETGRRGPDPETFDWFPTPDRPQP